MKPYCIASPDMIGNNVVSGGIRVMWGLYGWLLAKGQIVYMNRFPTGDTIGIYPEIYHNNPFNSQTVVRYILNTPGLMGYGTPGTNSFKAGPTQFDPSDKLYYFSRIFGNTDNEDHYMFLPILNLHIFKDQKKERKNTCYFVGKGKNLGVHPSNSIPIDRNLAMDQQALADCLNTCTMMWCYDDLSAMMEISRLCGCPVRYLGNYDKNKMSLYEPGFNGLIMPYEEDRLVYSDVFRETYLNMIKEFDRKIEIFIEETQ